jgi:hypothetical protein
MFILCFGLRISLLHFYALRFRIMGSDFGPEAGHHEYDLLLFSSVPPMQG